MVPFTPNGVINPLAEGDSKSISLTLAESERNQARPKLAGPSWRKVVKQISSFQFIPFSPRPITVNS